MNITVYPKKLSGNISAIPSKSQAHRLLICAAFSDAATEIFCPQTNQDIEATVDCLNALGAYISRTEKGYSVKPATEYPKETILNCRESGSTLRFMLPIAGALGVTTTFILSGRLPFRPLSPLWEEMERMGCTLSRPTENTIICQGKLDCGNYSISGNVSSQFITGLLFALALIPGKSNLNITGKTESIPYIQMTQKALAKFGVSTDNYCIKGSFPFHSPGHIDVEGDWSNGAFFLAAVKTGSNLFVNGLDPDSPQGDRAVSELLESLENNCTICAADVPDLVPILAVVAGCKKGATFTHIQRLRLKESDRVASVAQMLNSLGAQTKITEDTITVYPAQYRSCIIDSVGDHRIAMSAAIAATVANGPVTILGAECVCKSYPGFWDDFKKLGGNYEQHIR